MSLQIEKVSKNNEEEIWTIDSKNLTNKKKVFTVNKKNATIIFHFGKGHCVKEVKVTDCSVLPAFFSEKGYFKQGIGYYFDKMLSNKKIKSLTISKKDKTKFAKDDVVIPFNSIVELQRGISNINIESKKDKSDFVNNFFCNLFPDKYKKMEDSGLKKATKVLRILDQSIIEHLGNDGVSKFIDFFETLLRTKYSNQASRDKLLSLAKLKIDNVAIDEIINKFEQNIKNDCSENDWGKFLEKNLFLLDSKYIKSIPQLNLVMGGARNVDFGLVDSYGYLDIFEIKKPTTKLLSKMQDRGNYYWSTDAVKAITQAEKYLFNAEQKSLPLASDIEKEKDGLIVKVVRPRAILLIGNTDELDTKSKFDDFKILRNSLKNIEVVTYDELLIRLKNQKSRIYIDK